MKSKIFFTITMVLVVCCFLATNAWAARKVDFVSANANGYMQKLNNQGDHGRSAMGSIFGLTQGEKFKLVRQRTDFNSVTHSRYRQTYQGIPVWGIETIVSRDHTDEVVRINGAMVLDTPKDILSIPGTFDPQSALTRMEKKHKAKDANAIWNFSSETNGTYIYVDKKSKARLCYVVSFFADNEKGNPSRPIFFIDVKSGKVLDSYDMLAHATGTGPGGNLKVGQYEYGTDYPGFGVTINGTTCTMNTTNVKTVDLNHGTSGSTAYSYTCPRNTHENINGGYCPMNDAQYFGQVVFDTYNDWYGVAVLPFQLTLRCHYYTNYENAFWDGSTMTFGDGYTTFYPLVGLDVVAHEVSHGFTEYNSNLIYSGQSGGINESFSDMAGEAAKYYMRGTNDFRCGYDIFKAAGQALRYLYNPHLDGHSIDNVSEYYDGLDVHYSSGIFNKAFYLIATSSGWTTRMAFDIFVKANQDYWVPSSTFQQGAQGALDAAMDYGYPCTAVASAFANVGITLTCPVPPVANFVGSPTSGIIPLTVQFTDQSTGATSWSWNFGDSGTSTVQNPSHTYTTAGNYTVTLTAANAYGSDSETKTNYITATSQSSFNAEDLIVRTSDARLLLFPFENGIFTGTGTQVGHGWNFTHYFVGHWNTDYPTQDLIVRKSNGELWLYPYRNETFYTYGAQMVGQNFNYTDYFVGNWTDNATDDLLVRDSSGYMWLYPFNNGAFGSPISMGSGWNYTDYFVGNWSGDNFSDLICRDSSGNMWYFRFVNGAFASRVQVGNGWNFDKYFVGNWTNDGTDDLIVRSSDGTMRLYPFRNGSFYWVPGAGTIVATGWNFSDYFVGDWADTTNDDMLVRESNGNLKLYPFVNGTFGTGTTVGIGFNYTHYLVGQWTND